MLLSSWVPHLSKGDGGLPEKSTATAQWLFLYLSVLSPFDTNVQHGSALFVSVLIFKEHASILTFKFLNILVYCLQVDMNIIYMYGACTPNRKWPHITNNQSYRYLWRAMWVTGNKHISASLSHLGSPMRLSSNTV